MRSASSADSRRAEKRISAAHDGPDERDELLDPAERVPEAEARRRHRELASFRGDANVGPHGREQPAADAVAADHREDRLVELAPHAPRVGHRGVVVGAGVHGRAPLAELGDVGAGDERTVTRTA